MRFIRQTLIAALTVVGLMLGSSVLHQAMAVTITSQVGTPDEPTGSTTLGGTLTGGFIVADFTWTHSYTPITGTITSATLAFDTIDLDSFVGITGSLVNGANVIGTFTGQNNGVPGQWRGLGDSLNDDNLFPLSAVFFSPLLTGNFTISTTGTQTPVPNAWGSNRALLTINFTPSAAVPEPSSLLLLGSGLAGMAGWRWKQLSMNKG